MGVSTLGNRGPGGAGTYWRRRLAVLCAGLGVFAALAWAASSALGARAGTGHGGGASGHGGGIAAGSGHAGHPGGQAASRGTGLPSGAKARPESTGKPTVAAQVSPSASQPARQGVLPPYCSRQDIVLSLISNQASFAPGQVPSFSVNVVSTGPAACSFNLGPGFLELVIKEGPVTIWNSADCVRGSGALLSALRRGVPTVLTMNWNRRTSSPGCSSPVNHVPAGVYVAYAKQGSLTSAPVTFTLG